jgi:tol-pal system protein YbgF
MLGDIGDSAPARRAILRGAAGLSSYLNLPRFGLAAIHMSLGAAIIVALGGSPLRADPMGPNRTPIFRIAQSSGLPPGEIPDAPGAEQNSDPAALVVRIDRLENQLRAATGAIEELQNRVRQDEEQIKRFREDVEFRLGGAKGAPPTPDAAPPAKSVKRSDAFDPAADPNAPGAPRPIGTTQPSPPLADAPPVVSAPLDLSRNNPAPALPSGPIANAEEPPVIQGITAPPDDPREQYRVAMESYRSGQYDQAEKQLRAILAKNPGGRLASDATFYLGETFLQRSRPREAAEQYLKVSTDYAKSPRAPEAMLRLGQSLAALGNNDQACATFGEIGRRYPTAAAGVKKDVEREMQRDRCTAQ